MTDWKYGCYTEDVNEMILDTLHEETLTALTEYDLETDDAHSFIAAIGAMYMITEKIRKKLLTKEEEEENG
jgi:hypothetical protein